MAKRCARFGCNAAATATFTFDSRSLTVWLDTPADGAARAGELCGRHARALRLPEGWRLEDRRATASVGTSSAGAATTSAVSHPPAPARASGSTGPSGAGAVLTTTAAAPDAELASLLDARSPLLARAFRSSGRA